MNDKQHPGSALDALPPRTARAVRRAGVLSDIDLATKTCGELMLMRGVGWKSMRAVLEAAGTRGLRLACGCGGQDWGLTMCERAGATARRLGLEVSSISTCGAARPPHPN